jgi:RNA polymerase sigma factor (sigma-70 family)
MSHASSILRLAQADAPDPAVAPHAATRAPFEHVYRDHYAAIGGYIYRRTGDAHATDDLVAEVFLAALRAYPRYQDRGLPIRAWLLRIATNAVNKWARSRRRGRWLIFVGRGATDVAAAAAPAAADARSSREAMLTLSPAHQSVLALHYLEGLSVEEVAAVLGASEGTVKSRLSRAREALRKRLEGGSGSTTP